MAHVYKRLKARINRCIENSLELRGTSGDAYEEEIVLACIDVMQKAQASIYAMITNAEKLKTAPRRSPARSVPPRPPANPGLAPKYGPETGVFEAKPKQASTWAGRERIKTDDDDLVMLPHNMTSAQFVDYSLQGHTGSYEVDAARELSADAEAWGPMDDDERAAAIRARALELERDDDHDYFKEPKKSAAPVSGAASDAPDF